MPHKIGKVEKKSEKREKESSSREIYLYLFARMLTFISFPVELRRIVLL